MLKKEVKIEVDSNSIDSTDVDANYRDNFLFEVLEVLKNIVLQNMVFSMNLTTSETEKEL